MKHIKTLTMLLLSNSFSSNEITWKEIEAEIKPYAESIESDIAKLKKKTDEIQKEYRILIGEAEFDNLEANENTKKGYNRATKGDKRANKKKLIEAKKQNSKINKKYSDNYKNDKIKEIKKNIEEIIENKKKVQINKKEIELKNIENLDIEKIKKDFNEIRDINKKMERIDIYKLKTFSELQAFSKEFNQVKYLKEKVYNDNYLYNLVFTAIKKKIAIPFLNITEENTKENAEKIAESFYSYETAFQNFSIIFDDNFHKIVMKNVLNEEKIAKQKDILKEKYRRILDITVFTALSNKQDKKTLEENAPAILAMLETLKGTEEENKKMSVQNAIEIFNKFISLANKETNKGPIIEKTERIEKLEEEYKEQTFIDGKTETKRTESSLEKIKEKGQNKRIAAENNSKEKQQEVKKSIWETTKKEERLPVIKSTESLAALKKAKQKGKASVKAEINQNYYDFDNKEKSNYTSILSKKELESAKKGSSKEV
jgi:hypothetical protein